MEAPQAPIQQTIQHPVLRQSVEYVGYYVAQSPSRSSGPSRPSAPSAPSSSPLPLNGHMPVPTDRTSTATAEQRAAQQQISSYSSPEHERPSSPQPHHRRSLIVGGGTEMPRVISRDDISRDAWRPLNAQAPSGRQYINTQVSDNATVVQGDVSTQLCEYQFRDWRTACASCGSHKPSVRESYN